jgi:transposase
VRVLAMSKCASPTFARRSAEGKSPREIKRCLKRHLARRLFKLLEGPQEHPVRDRLVAA